jgi:hypothetical protein
MAADGIRLDDCCPFPPPAFPKIRWREIRWHPESAKQSWTVHPPPLSPEACQTVSMLIGTAISFILRDWQPHSTETIPPPHAPKRREIHARRVKILHKMAHEFAGIRFFHVFLGGISSGISDAGIFQQSCVDSMCDFSKIRARLRELKTLNV